MANEMEDGTCSRQHLLKELRFSATMTTHRLRSKGCKALFRLAHSFSTSSGGIQPG
jgi:hypothetical protein